MTKIKICGITNIVDALRCAELGADLIGFNFFSGSKRHIDAESVKRIVGGLSGPVLKAGVFVDQPAEEVAEVQAFTGLDVIQLHGNESPEYVSALRNETPAKIIKAFRVHSDFDPKYVEEYYVDGILLDSFASAEFGGTGTTFDWRIAADLAARNGDVYLAGGLNPENVSEAIRTVRPYAVDVASGVESAAGKKDPAKLEEFIRRAKETI